MSMAIRGDLVTHAEKLVIKGLAEQAVARFGPKITMVNIGVGPGATLHALRLGAPQGRLVGVDISPHRLAGRCPKRQDLLEPLEKILGDSTSLEVQSQIQAPVHVILIDGGHDYEVVKADIEGWTPKIPKGGFVIFHDFSPPKKFLNRNPALEGVNRAIKEWCASVKGWTQCGRADSLIAFERKR
jgi:hypothetical protein